MGTTWSITERREIDRVPMQLEAHVRDAIFTAVGIEPKRKDTSWRVIVPGGLSVFNERAIVVEVRASGDVRSTVEATLELDGSDFRIIATMWLMTSLIGLPLGMAVREASIRSDRRFARRFFEKFWETLSRLTHDVYR